MSTFKVPRAGEAWPADEQRAECSAPREARFRTEGIGCTASGVLGIALGALTLGWSPAVDDKVWSYPFSFPVGLVVGVVLALVHLMTLGGYVGVRSVVGSGAARVGASIAIGGFALLAACEVAGGAIGKQQTDSTAVGVMGALFGVASLLVAGGSITAGATVVRTARRGSGRTPGFVGWSLLLSGLTLLLLVTPANISGDLIFRMAALMLWSAFFVPLGVVLVRHSGSTRRRV